MSVESWKARAKELKREIYALYLCSRHPRTPLPAKLLAAFILAYAISPIDLIPDFVPVLGYVDDLLLIPAGIALLIRMVPKDVLQECRDKAQENPPETKMRSWKGAAMVVFIWLAAIYATYWLVSLFAR